MAVLTRALSATVLAIFRASSRLAQPAMSMVTRCVAPSPSAGIARASSWQTSFSACWNVARSAPASGGVPAAPLANSSTVSLVLMWPSTLMQLKLSSTASRQSSLGHLGSQRRVGQHHAEHRGHIRTDHCRPFGHAGDLHRASAERERPTGQLVRGVGGQHAPGRGDQGIFVVGQQFLGRAGYRLRSFPSAGIRR